MKADKYYLSYEIAKPGSKDMTVFVLMGKRGDHLIIEDQGRLPAPKNGEEYKAQIHSIENMYPEINPIILMPK